jgi:hypothetical protein
VKSIKCSYAANIIGLHIQTSKFQLKMNKRPKQWYLKGRRIWQFFHCFSNISPHSKGDYLISACSITIKKALLISVP